MLVHEIDLLLEAKPFVSFTVITADGRKLRVKSREFAWHPAGYRTAWIAMGKEGDQRVHMVDLQFVTQLVVERGQLPSTEFESETPPEHGE
jgi:hypothetical protein